MQEEAPPAQDAAATLEVTHDGADGEIVRLTGELDLNSIGMLEPQIARVLERRPARLVVDVTDLTFADSSAITLWLRWSAAVESFELRGASPLLRTIIVRMGLAPRFGLS